jgi:hypothetical protein
MYIVYLHITEKESPTFEFATMELAQQYCLVVTQAKDVQSAMICKHGAGKNMLILETYAQGCCIG